MKRKDIIFVACLLLVMGVVIGVREMQVHAQALGSGGGTISTLEQWKSDGTNITQRTASKPIKLTGLATGLCLTLTAGGVVTTTTCGSGGGGGGSGLATSTVDYIVNNIGNTTYAIKTSTGSTLSSSQDAAVVLQAVVADASTLGANIAFGPGTFYLNSTTTFNGTTDFNGATWKLVGSGQGTTKFVVNNNADAFYFHGTVKATANDFTIFLKGAANGITASSTFGFRSLWNSNFSNITITGTTTNSTGYGFNMVDDDHNVFTNLYIQNVGNCWRSATDFEGKFNPGDATLSNIHCTFGAPSGGGAVQNTYTGGVGFWFDSSATTSTAVNQDTLINVLTADLTDGTRTAFRFNHSSNIRGLSVESEGFATTSELYNSKYVYMNWEYVVGSATLTHAYFFDDSTSVNNTNACTEIDSHAGPNPLWVDQNSSQTNQNILIGANEGVCDLIGAGDYSFATSAVSIIRRVHGTPIGELYNGFLMLTKRLLVGSTTPISGGLNFELQGNAAETYSPSTFSSLRAAIVNTNLTQGNFADFDLDMYDASQNQITTGTRLMSIFDHNAAKADFAIVNGHIEVVRFTGTGNEALATTTAFWGLTVASSSGPQIGLTDTNPADLAWTLRSINNNLYFATSTALATSTTAAFWMDGNGVPTFGTLAGGSVLCVHASATGQLSLAAADCGTGGGSAGDPFTHPSTSVSATTSGLIISASSTISSGLFTMAGGASTTAVSARSAQSWLSSGVDTTAQPALAFCTGANASCYAIGIQSGRGMIGFDGTGGYMILNGGASKGIQFKVGGTSNGFNTGTVALTMVSGTGNGSLGSMVMGTSSSYGGLFTIATSTASQLILSDVSTANPTWNLRSISGSFFLASSTAAATSTTAAFSISPNGVFTFNGGATSTFSAGVNVADINETGNSTSTFVNGINATGGCFSVNGTCVGNVTASFANPSQTIGLSVVNGSAGTGIRSDGAPALSQAIAPTWTGLHQWTGGASSTMFSIYNKAYFGATATSTFDSTGALTLAAYAQFSKAQRVRWNDDNDSITVTDLPSFLSTRNNVMSFRVYNGDATQGVFAFTDHSDGIKMLIDAVTGRVGVGSTTPWATFAVVGNLNQPLFAVATSTTGTASSSEPIFMIDQNEHEIYGGGQPTISGCGTNPTITGNDNVMRITTGSTGVTECTITFAKSWAPYAQPVCTHDEEGTTATVTIIASTTQTTLKVGLSASLTSATMGFHCKSFQ